MFWERTATLYKYEAFPWKYKSIKWPEIELNYLSSKPIFKDSQTLYFERIEDFYYSLTKMTLG